jgi:hypothetical protein
MSKAEAQPCSPRHKTRAFGKACRFIRGSAAQDLQLPVACPSGLLVPFAASSSAGGSARHGAKLYPPEPTSLKIRHYTHLLYAAS